ncbi:replication initiation and membrane attachment family protein [Pseudalkalibacillus berkeleyi]|uniref:DnaD domain protein n=1 Tax=Pseudalkalibacillus berkeleyi TaxID=1069813 RepID=A0ABS9H2N6_9BACL|nr:DnaD domain protein [Pseudalkalibacillus berkeleyi]MCF6138186.1 DnaD domain protein [Pseudalkalibacillus berkeleyi]
MVNYWKEILPVDRYQVQSSGHIHFEELKVVTLLYQPLIGAKAYSLYMTLFSERFTGESTHHSLMNHTQMNLQHIFEERKKLEAIGLLKSFQKSTDDERKFTYELQPVLKPEQFFQDDVLSVYLYGRLGKERYLEIKKRICLEQVGHDEDYKEVTANFNDVFSSLHQSEMRAGLNSEFHQSDKNHQHKSENQEQSIPKFSNEDFDFETLVRDLSSFIIPAEVLTESIKDSIYRLAFIYRISPLEMSSIVQQAYFRDDELTPTSLRQEVQRWYKIEKPGQLPRLSERKQQDTTQTHEKQPELSREEMMVKTFETISPRALLERYSEGGRAASADLKVIDSIMFDQKLPIGVINVLIDYVLNTNDMKLIQSHVEKIASQWKRKKITSVREAMALAKAEHQNYQAYKQKKSNPNNRSYQRNNVRKDKLPKWMASQQEDQSTKKEENTTKEEKKSVSESEEKWLEEYLKGL